MVDGENWGGSDQSLVFFTLTTIMEPKKRWIDFKTINEKKKERSDWEIFMEQSLSCPHFYWLEDEKEKVKFAKCKVTKGNSCRMHLCPLKNDE